MKYKLVAFDMDGTLVKGNGSWVRIHRHFGTLEIGDRNLRDYEEGKIDYEEFMKRDISAWLSKKRVHLSTIERILSDFQLVDDAGYVIEKLKERKIIPVVITSGIDLLARKVADKLGIVHFFSNSLQVDKNGYLTGEGILGVDPTKKDLILKKICRKLGVKKEESIAVGDSKYDSSLLKSAGLGIAYGRDEELCRIADASILSLKELLLLV
jgi:phosphoserine phosphatase